MEKITATCKTCDFWVKNTNPQDLKNISGECRARPPQIIAVPVQTPQGPALNIQTMFPLVGEKAFCSLHPEIQVQIDLEKVLPLSEFEEKLP